MSPLRSQYLCFLFSGITNIPSDMEFYLHWKFLLWRCFGGRLHGVLPKVSSFAFIFWKIVTTKYRILGWTILSYSTLKIYFRFFRVPLLFLRSQLSVTAGGPSPFFCLAAFVIFSVFFIVLNVSLWCTYISLYLRCSALRRTSVGGLAFFIPSAKHSVNMSFTTLFAPLEVLSRTQTTCVLDLLTLPFMFLNLFFTLPFALSLSHITCNFFRFTFQSTNYFFNCV